MLSFPNGVGKKHNTGFTLVEAIVAILVALPIILILWNAIIGSRSSEARILGQGEALKGSMILEKYIRKDISSIDNQAKTPVEITASGDICTKLVLKTIEAGSGIAMSSKTVVYEVKAYDKDPTGVAYEIFRNGWKLKQVVVEKFLPSIERGQSLGDSVDGDSFRRWLMIEVKTLDPGLQRSKNKEIYSSKTTILCNVPWSPASVSYIDYTTMSGGYPSIQGWIERMSYDAALVGGWNANSPGTKPTFVSRIDNNVYPLEFVDESAGNTETSGASDYTKLKFQYYEALRILFGDNYRTKKIDFALGVKSSLSATPLWFYEEKNFIPYPFTDLESNEIKIASCAYIKHPFNSGLAVFFTTNKSGRCGYRITYPGPSGSYQAPSWSIGKGIFFAYLPGFPEYGELSLLKLATSWDD